jgi:hypothetical protein
MSSEATAESGIGPAPDRDEIIQVVRLYTDGFGAHRPEMFEEAFHPSASFSRVIKQTKRVSVNRPSLRGIAEAHKVPELDAARVDDGRDGVFGEERRWSFGSRRTPTVTGWSGRAAMSSWSTGFWPIWLTATSPWQRGVRTPTTC